MRCSPSSSGRRAEYRGHIWTYDFVHDRTEQGGLLKFLPVSDEDTREAHAIEVGRSFTGTDVVEVLLRLFRLHGEPDYIRSDNGSEFVARVVGGAPTEGRGRFAFDAPDPTPQARRYVPESVDLRSNRCPTGPRFPSPSNR